MPRGFSLATIALACACGPVSDLAGSKEGDLGKGEFQYQCVGHGDRACSSTASNAAAESFPRLVASGAELGLVYRYDDNGAYGSVSAVSDAFFTTTSNGYRAAKPGSGAFLATFGGNVVDITYVRVAPIDAVGVADLMGRAVPPKLTVAATLDVQATPVDADGQILAGDVTWTWSTSDPSVLSVTAAKPSWQAKLRAESAGTATLTVTALVGTDAPTASVDVEVTP